MELIDITKDYLILLKPHVIWLLILASLAGYLYASLPHFSWAELGELALIGLLSTGGSAAFNHYWERDIDAKMERTARRPLASGRLSPLPALIYSMALSALGFALSAIWFNASVAICVVAGWFFYSIVYTVLLKRRHWSNILIGGFAGNAAFLAGWLAAAPLALKAVLASFAVWIWIPAHIWSLAYVYRRDYREAGVPMLTAQVAEPLAVSVVSALDVAAAIYMLAFLAIYKGFLSLAVMAPAAALAIYLGLKALVEKTDKAFWRVFKSSSPLLTIFFIALLI